MPGALAKRLAGLNKQPGANGDAGSPAAASSPAAAAPAAGGLKGLRSIVHRARVKGATNALKVVAKEVESASMKQRMAEKARALRRRVSVDEGDPNWPSDSHMNTLYEPAGDTVEELTALVDEIHMVQRPDAVAAADAGGGGGARRRAASHPAPMPDAPSFLDASMAAVAEDRPNAPAAAAESHHTPSDPAAGDEGENRSPEPADDGYDERGRPTRETRLQLPRERDVAQYPGAVWNRMRECASAILVSCVVPRFRLRQASTARATQSEHRRQMIGALTPEIIQRIPLYRMWPADALKRIATSASFAAYSAGDVLVYAREPSSSTLYLARGTIAVVPKGVRRDAVALRPNPKVKNGPLVPPQSALDAGVTYINGPHVLGELNVLVDEPWPSRLVAATMCDVFALPREGAAKELDKMPEDVVEATHRVAQERRRAEMPTLRPFSPACVREIGLLKAASPGFAEEIASRVEPFVVRAGAPVATEGSPADALYFIRRGRTKATRMVGGEETLVKFTAGAAVVGDAELIANNATYLTGYVALTDVDAYQLSRTAFHAVAKMFPADAAGMARSLTEQRREDLKRNLLRHRDLAHDLPLFKSLNAGPFDVRDLLALLHPVTYKPFSSVCSQSVFADRVIIVIRGRLRYGESGTAGPKDVLGWTCTVPHRWGVNCMTLGDTCDTLEMDGEAYIDFLRERGYLATVKERTLALLFPKAHTMEQVQNVRASLPPTAMFVHPVSNSTRVNLNEERFCTVHMAELRRNQKAEIERAAARRQQTPPPFRAVSGSLWTPKRHVSRGFSVSKTNSPIISDTPPPLPGRRLRKV